MDLRKRIEKDLVTKQSRYGPEEVLPDEARAIIQQEVIDWFKSIGWQTRTGTSSDRFISRMGNHHTQIKWHMWNRQHWVEVRFRAHTGGWRSLVSQPYMALDEAVKKALAIPAPVITSKSTLPEPLKFQEGEKFIVRKVKPDNSQHSYTMAFLVSNVASARCNGPVGLEEDGTVSLSEAFKPNETVWLHLELQDHRGCEFDIITDGEVFHPVKRTGKKKVTADVTGQLMRINSLDYTVIQAAIDHYWAEDSK